MVRGIDNLEKEIEGLLDYYLEEYSFEEFLEFLDLTPYEVFMSAINAGLVDLETMEESLPQQI